VNKGVGKGIERTTIRPIGSIRINRRIEATHVKATPTKEDKINNDM